MLQPDPHKHSEVLNEIICRDSSRHNDHLITRCKEMCKSPTAIPLALLLPHRPDETTPRQPMVFLRFSQTLSSSFLYIGLLLYLVESIQFKVLYVSLPRKLLRSHYKNQALSGFEQHWLFAYQRHS